MRYAVVAQGQRDPTQRIFHPGGGDARVFPFRLKTPLIDPQDFGRTTALQLVNAGTRGKKTAPGGSAIQGLRGEFFPQDSGCDPGRADAGIEGELASGEDLQRLPVHNHLAGEEFFQFRIRIGPGILLVQQGGERAGGIDHEGQATEQGLKDSLIAD